MLQKSRSLAANVLAVMSNRLAPSDFRGSLAGGSLDAALEHHRAVVVLVEQQLFGSAFALLRPAYEACITALWCIYVATNHELDEFARGRYKLDPQKVINRLKSKDDGDYTKTLQRLHSQSWDTLNGYVHSRNLAIQRRNAESFIGSNYDPEEVLEVLEFANTLAIIAAMELPGLTQDRDFEVKMKELVCEFVAKQA